MALRKKIEDYLREKARYEFYERVKKFIETHNKQYCYLTDGQKVTHGRCVYEMSEFKKVYSSYQEIYHEEIEEYNRGQSELEADNEEDCTPD